MVLDFVDLIIIFLNMTGLVYEIMVLIFYLTVDVFFVVYDFGRMLGFIFTEYYKKSLLLYCCIGIFLFFCFLNIGGSFFSILLFASISLFII